MKTFTLRGRPVGFQPGRFGGALVAVERGFFPISPTGYRSLSGAFANADESAAEVPPELPESLAANQDKERRRAFANVQRAPRLESDPLRNYLGVSSDAEKAFAEGFFAPDTERVALWSGAFRRLCLIDGDARFQPANTAPVWTPDYCAQALAAQRALLDLVRRLAAGDWPTVAPLRPFGLAGYFALPPKPDGERCRRWRRNLSSICRPHRPTRRTTKRRTSAKTMRPRTGHPKANNWRSSDRRSRSDLVTGARLAKDAVMQQHGRMAQSDADRLVATIGQEAVASVLFKPRIEAEAIEAIASAMLSGLKVHPASVNLVAHIERLPPDRIASWATQMWINVVGELTATDPKMAHAFASGGYLPRDKAMITLYKKKLAERFHCFVWLVGWRGAVGDFANCFTARLILLDTVIRIEDLQAKLDGQPGGWGLLDAVVEGAKRLSAVTQQRVKTIATNERVEKAFKRRGFVASTSDQHVHTEKARPLELPASPPSAEPKTS